MVPTEVEELKEKQRQIGKEHMRGMMADRTDHPFVKRLKDLGLGPDEYTYEMISQPLA